MAESVTPQKREYETKRTAGSYTMQQVARWYRVPLRLVMRPVPYKRNARRYGR